jgi:uncharacterized protein (UPF0332 family)
VKPETARFVEFARDMLSRASRMASIDLHDDAGRRAAYLACFHVAQAIIFEREDRVLKTHHGVQTEFNRIMKDDPRADKALVGFVARAHKYKTVADYGFDTPVHSTADDARKTLQEATRFFDTFTALLNPAPSPNQDLTNPPDPTP